MRESVARAFIEMSTAYAKDTAHVRKQFETSAEQSQHLTTFAQKDIPTHGRPTQTVAAATTAASPRPFLNVCYDTLRKYNLHGASWRPSLSNRLEAAPHAQVALTRSVRDAYTMRILRRQIRTRSPAMVSNAVLLKALPREISYQAHRAQRPSASVVGFLKSRMTKFVVPNPLAYSQCRRA